MHSVLGQRKQRQKQYIAVMKKDLFHNTMGLCGNFTQNKLHTDPSWSLMETFIDPFSLDFVLKCTDIYRIT